MDGRTVSNAAWASVATASVVAGLVGHDDHFYAGLDQGVRKDLGRCSAGFAIG